MKNLVLAAAAVFSFNTMAGTTLVCNDQNSHSVYKLEINDSGSKMVFSPILRDSSTLSKSVATLRFNEGESNEALVLFEGRNEDQSTIVVETLRNELYHGKLAELNVSFSKGNSKLDQSTIFLCDVTVK